MPDTAKANARTGSPFSRSQAQRAAEESLILLKNDGILPLSDTAVKTLAVLGPNQDHPLQQNGDWSLGTGQANQFESHPREATITVLDGFKQRFGSKGKILSEAGATIVSDDTADLSRAIEYAQTADATIVVIGDRFRYYGELKSTATLELMGTQKELLHELIKTKKPFVLVVISSKPIVIDAEIRDAAGAIIWQFCPGMLGGLATARAVFGDINPQGRLTISIPAHVGQQPCYYQQIRGMHGETYADYPLAPAYPFGFGIGYAKIEYRVANVARKSYTVKDNITVTVSLENTGTVDAVEIVQVYVSDLVTSATWATHELKGFKRVAVPARSSVKAESVVPAATLSIVNASAQRVVEPGVFEIQVGPSSADIKFRITINIKAQ